MKFSQFVSSLSLLATVSAQTFAEYTDSNGIKFWQATASTTLNLGNMEWGMALPEAKEGLTDEYIGHLVVPRTTSGNGWLGLSHAGAMTESLLLVTWVDGSDIMTSFRYASGYTAPDIYTGNASLTQISSSINDTHYELTYRCESCWTWDQAGASASQVPATTSAAAQIIGWAQATVAPSTLNDADSTIVEHAADGIFGAVVASARNSAYTSWVSLATATPTSSGAAPTGNTTSSGNGTANSTAPAVTSVPCPAKYTIPNTTYDYIIVGAGAGGIPMADKLSAAGNSVLLIERGPPSSGRWGGTMKPAWLDGTNLTRFDVPGLDNEIWVDSAGIACPDYSVMAGCVLGGGTAVNAGLWWRANPKDFDYNFPEGWKSKDMQSSIDRVFERIPFTQVPSTNGILYKPCGYDIVGGALAASGYKNVTADDVPAEKNFTFSHPNEMFSHGERGGPMATYLVTAHERSNFKMWTNTTVNRLVRTGGHITGVEVQAYGIGGLCGTVNVTPKTGRVILSAGTFGTPKILFRSGIGPSDQLEVVKASTDGSAMIKKADWINLPVGYNLDDHCDTDVTITHPNVSFYNFYAAYNTPIKSDAEDYLDNRTGILTQSAPNLSAVFWQEILGSDNITRQLQWTARVESSHGLVSDKAMTISQYLGRGATSRGRTTIDAGLNMVVSEMPYLNNKYDVEAVVAGIDSIRKVLSSDPKITFHFPAANQTSADFVSTYPITTGERSANHWIGTCKIGMDSGLVNNGTAVVDLNTKVYGTDNLFVVDASIFPGMMTTNPSALIVAVAEHASEKILALPAAANATNATVVAAATASSSYITPVVSSASALPYNPSGIIANITSALPTGALTSIIPTALPTGPAFPTGGFGGKGVPSKPLPAGFTMEDLLEWINYLLSKMWRDMLHGSK